MYECPYICLYIPCMFYAFLLKSMESRSLLQSQNASDLEFLPPEIHLGKEEGENQERVVETRQNVGFPHPRICLREVEGGSKKVQENYKSKLTF